MWSAGVFEDAFSHMDLESSTIYRALQAGASTVNQPQRYINASGKYIHTINTTIPVKDADGKLLAVIEVANDVTQLSELCDPGWPICKVRWGRRRHPKNRSSNAITFPI